MRLNNPIPIRNPQPIEFTSYLYHHADFLRSEWKDHKKLRSRMSSLPYYNKRALSETFELNDV